jgi:hypothetical protein
VACLLGIYAGDVGLWALGRFGGRRILRWRAVARVPAGSLERLGAWIDRRPAAAIFASRFLPGTRVPLYVAAGIWGRRSWRFLGWMFLAAAVWTPALVLAAALAGRAAVAPLEAWTGHGWVAGGIVALAWLALLKLGAALATADGRARAAVRLARLRRWEFWPAWATYAPVAPWILWLALRHRSPTVFTAANPGIEDGGFVGESKSAILARLPRAWVMPWTTVEPGPIDARAAAACSSIAALGWRFPIVAKPDAGERGTGVRWLRDEAALRDYLTREPARVLLQVPHDGPFEAGIFYVRSPGAALGRIVSITDKRFPVVIGDGRSTLESLIRTHPRLRLQSDVFLARHAAEAGRVLVAGERLQLARAGNHAQGTEFRNGWWLWTPALEARVDAMAREFEGFYFGRFDVRYRSRDAFRSGEDLAVIELNGVTSEPTHIYDPHASLVAAWRTLMGQWSLAFAIGAANRARGHRPSTLRRLGTLIRAHLRATRPHPISD